MTEIAVWECFYDTSRRRAVDARRRGGENDEGDGERVVMLGKSPKSVLTLGVMTSTTDDCFLPFSPIA